VTGNRAVLSAAGVAMCTRPSLRKAACPHPVDTIAATDATQTRTRRISGFRRVAPTAAPQSLA
jgi:hypothetical protein